MLLDIQTVHHILKNTAVQNVNKPFVYITDLTSTLTSWNEQGSTSSKVFFSYLNILMRGYAIVIQGTLMVQWFTQGWFDHDYLMADNNRHLAV
jgi:hypothetical protein